MELSEDVLEAFCSFFALAERTKYKGILDRFTKKPYVVELLENKLSQGHSPLLVIVGETGKGKSMTTLTFAEHFHGFLNFIHSEYKPFTRENVFWDMEDMALGLHKFERSVVALEEGGENIRYDAWNDSFNRAFATIQGTQRYRNCLYIVCVPDIELIASRHYTYITAIIEKTSKKSFRSTIIKKQRSRVTGKKIYQPVLDHFVTGIPMPSKLYLEIYRESDTKNKENILKNAGNRLLSKKREFEVKQELRETRLHILKNKIRTQEKKELEKDFQNWLKLSG